MGNEHAKSGQSTIKADLDTSKLDLTIKQIFYTARLSKDRKKGLANSKVKELNALVNQEKHLRKKDDEYHKATSIVNDLKIIHALELIMTYCDSIKDNLGVIRISKGDLSKISELTPYVESIIWGCQKCNIEGSEALIQIIQNSFGPEARDNVLTLAHVTQQLRDCFDSVLPSNQQVHDYFIDFCRTQNFDIQKLSKDEVGHNITIPTPQTTANIHPETRIGNIADNKESIGHRSQETPSFGHGNFFPDGFSQDPQSGYPDQKQAQGDVYMSFGNTGHQRNTTGDNIEERKMDSNDFIRTEERDKGNSVGGTSKYPDFAMFSVVGKNDQNGSELNQLEDRLNAIKKNL